MQRGRRPADQHDLRHQAGSWYESMGIMVGLRGRELQARHGPVEERRYRCAGTSRTSPEGEQHPRRHRARARRPAVPAGRAGGGQHREDRGLQVRAGRPDGQGLGQGPGKGPAGPVAHVRQRRRHSHHAVQPPDLALDHRLPGAVPTSRRASAIRLPTGPAASTPASSASAVRASRRSTTSRPGRRLRTSRWAPTRTSAGSTRSCAVRSGSCRTSHFANLP